MLFHKGQHSIWLQWLVGVSRSDGQACEVVLKGCSIPRLVGGNVMVTQEKGPDDLWPEIAQCFRYSDLECLSSPFNTKYLLNICHNIQSYYPNLNQAPRPFQNSSIILGPCPKTVPRSYHEENRQYGFDSFPIWLWSTPWSFSVYDVCFSLLPLSVLFSNSTRSHFTLSLNVLYLPKVA